MGDGLVYRRVLAALLIPVVVLAMVGCGGGDDDGGSPTATVATSSGSATSGDNTFTADELETFATDLVTAIINGDKEQLTELLTGIVPQQRIDELAACKPADMTVSNVDIAVNVSPPTMNISGTVDVTQNGKTETKVITWNTELSRTSDGQYTLSALPSGCPFVFQ